MPRLSKALQKRYGQLSWYNQLLKAGRVAEASKWANKHKLHTPHPTDANSCIQGNAAAKPPTSTADATAQGLSAAVAALSSQPSVQGTDAARVARSAQIGRAHV